MDILFSSKIPEYSWLSNFHVAPFNLGRKVKLRPNWEAVKEGYMYRALNAKFTQHPELGLKLVATGDAILKEATARDYYWAIGRTGTGKNRLGYWLMRLREELRGQ